MNSVGLLLYLGVPILAIVVGWVAVLLHERAARDDLLRIQRRSTVPPPTI